MASKKTEIKTEKIEREYVIPLRDAWKKVPRYKRAAKAIRTIKEFLVKHMKIYDRDLKKIKIDKYLNEFVWFRGIKKPPYKIKVRAIRDGEIVKVELAELPAKLKFKKLREEKIEKASEEKGKRKKAEKKKEESKEEIKKEESKEEIVKENAEEQKSEKKEGGTEKKSAVVEAGKQLEKQQAKGIKQETKLSKAPKHQFRQALQK